MLIMSKVIRHSQYETIKDEVTGRLYERISPKGIQGHYPYFYLRMINPNTNQMLIILKEEERNLFLLSLEDGRLEQITNYKPEDEFADYGPQFTKDYSAVIYCVRGTIVKHNLETGVIEALYSSDEGWDTYTVPAISDDGRYIFSVDFYAADYMNKDNSNWDAFRAQGKAGLRSQLFRLDLVEQTKEVLIDTATYETYGHKKNQWLGHPQFKPGDNKVMSYCHEGQGGTVDARIWLYDYNTKAITCPRKHEHDDEIISHEFFTEDGKAIGFVRIENNESDQGSLRFVDSESYEEETILELPRCSHFLTNSDESFVIADADYPAQPYIHLIDVKEKKDIFLLKHNSSMKSYGNTQDAHPHPLFSPDSSKIYFVSDMEGYPAIYQCDVSDLTKKDLR